MLKFFLGIAIIGFTTLCGYLFAKKYRQKQCFFTQMKEFNERFLSEISYYRRPIRDFIAEYSYQGEFNLLLQSFYAGVEENALSNRMLNELTEFTFLKEEERRFTENYFLMLGRGDSVSQKGYFTSVKEQLCKLQVSAENSSKKYGDLYIKLGFLCGLLILILII